MNEISKPIRMPTELPTLNAEALEKAVAAYEQCALDRRAHGSYAITYIGALQAAITAYYAHIAQRINEEDESKAF